MTNLTKQGSSLIVTSDEQFPWGSGKITLPMNSVFYVLDESDAVIFKSVANGDILFQALIGNLTIDGTPATKDNIIALFDAVGNGATGGGGGGSTNVQVLTQAEYDQLAEKDENVIYIISDYTPISTTDTFQINDKKYYNNQIFDDFSKALARNKIITYVDDLNNYVFQSVFYDEPNNEYKLYTYKHGNVYYSTINTYTYSPQLYEVTLAEDAGLQEKLVGTETEGQNIKTVNGESLLGTGNIEIQGGGDSTYDLTSLYDRIKTSGQGNLTNEEFASINAAVDANKVFICNVDGSGSMGRRNKVYFTSASDGEVMAPSYIFLGSDNKFDYEINVDDYNSAVSAEFKKTPKQSSGAVESVNGKTGAVTITAGDLNVYTKEEVNGLIPEDNVFDATELFTASQKPEGQKTVTPEFKDAILAAVDSKKVLNIHAGGANVTITFAQKIDNAAMFTATNNRLDYFIQLNTVDNTVTIQSREVGTGKFDKYSNEQGNSIFDLVPESTNNDIQVAFSTDQNGVKVPDVGDVVTVTDVDGNIADSGIVLSKIKTADQIDIIFVKNNIVDDFVISFNLKINYNESQGVDSLRVMRVSSYEINPALISDTAMQALKGKVDTAPTIVRLTQSEYDQLAEKDANTLYYITDAQPLNVYTATEIDNMIGGVNTKISEINDKIV